MTKRREGRSGRIYSLIPALALVFLILVFHTVARAMPQSQPAAPPAQSWTTHHTVEPSHNAAAEGTTPSRAYLPLISRGPVPPANLPFGVNCGGGEIVLADGRRFIADQELSIFNGVGYVGGEAITTTFEWEPVENTEEDILYRTAREGMAAYHASVPNDRYLVELHAAEIGQHGPDFRIFDVVIEEQPAQRALDIYALAQHDYAMVFRQLASVDDGQLDIVFSASTGLALVSGIWVERYVPDGEPPLPPTEIEVIGGFRQAIVRWDPVQQRDVAGYRVYSGPSASGPFQAVSEIPTALARWLDDAVMAGQHVCYAVATIDLEGNESQRSQAACAAVVGAAASSLEVLDLTVSPADLRMLAANPFAEREAPGRLAIDGRQFDVMAGYRGATSRASNKKSWRLEASRSLPPWDAETLLINGEALDPAMIREKLAYDLFAETGIEPPQASFVHLTLNGEFMGVFTRVENPERDFLRRTGRNPDDDVFRCHDGLGLRPDCENLIVAGRSTDDLYALAALVNRTPDDEFASAVTDVLDVPAFLDYLAVTALVANQDATFQYLLHRSQTTGRWQVLPWDQNLSFSVAGQPVDYGAAAHPGLYGQVNVLMTRVLDVPQFRRYFGQRLLELAADLFSTQSFVARVHAAQSSIMFDAERDVWKFFREDNDALERSLWHLPDFAAHRVTYLQQAVPSYMPAQSRFFALNEVMANNSLTIMDPADNKADPWFELFNAGLEPAAIGGMYLTDSQAAPTRFRIPDGTVLPALSAQLFWADGQTAQGANHVSFTLPASGGEIFLVDRDGSSVISAVRYPALPADVAWGQFPNTTGQWIQFRQPTPGASNRLLPPVIDDVIITPRSPQAGQVVTVTANIADDGAVSHTSLFYRAGAPAVPLAMFDDGHHGDGAANDGRYGAQIPGLPDRSVVDYYLSASDDYGRVAFFPAAAPESALRYRVGYQPGQMLISEFMAANTTTIEDPNEPGEYPDWIELLNAGNQTINLNGYYLTDNLQRPQKFRINTTVLVEPGQAVLIWADDDEVQGPLHTNFKLDKDGEAVGLIDPNGSTLIDAVTFLPQSDDVSFGRCPMIDGVWGHHFQPTPGQPNACIKRFLPVGLRQ